MTKLYIAGASAEREMIRVYMREMTAAGYEITHDWVAVIDAHGGVANGPEVKDAKRVAAQNIVGVEGCDVFWMVAGPSVGCWVELGVVLSVRLHTHPLVVISGPTRSVFTSLADVEFSMHEDAAGFLRERVKRGGA